MITSSLFILTFVVSTYGLPKSIPPNVGRVCGFGDFNNDRFTDIVVQRGRNLTILLYDDAIRVLEEGIFNNASIIDVGNDEVECSMGDFNGDAKLDILVSQRVSDREFKHTLWIAKSAEPFDIFVRKDLETLQSQAMAVDVNGDGQHDIFGFLANGSIYCQRITTIIDEMMFIDCSMEEFYDQRKEFFDIYPGMPHLYADVLGDLYAELVVMNRTENGYLQMVVLQRIKNNVWRKRDSIPVLQQKNIGAPIPGDFNADMKLEILVPVCQEEQCEHISHFAMWERDNGWSNISIDLGSASVISDSGSKVLFRVGDFTSDGYPDLIATFLSDKAIVAKILENVPCPHCEGNDTRKFEVRKMALIQPKEIALGTLTMSSFFDLKEDGSLDILLEYNYSGARKFSFISCEDKGDTTFLKVSVFTNCQNPNTCDIDGKPGTGISWGGACMYFTMSDGWGGSLRSTSCQQPAQTYRSLMAPYVLFGLGRSPNFVDELVVGSPRYADKMTSSWRQHSQKQIVPNSRIIMMPPPLGSTGWTSRLYVTPSTLILQSLVVITVVCIILMIVVCFLHGRERKEDRIERQQQSHRFHFDAM